VSVNGQLDAIGANGTSKSLFHNTGGGAYVAGDVVWGNKNAIAVLPSKSYEISYYMNDNGGGNPPQIEMWANGVKLGNTATSTTSWVKYTYNWNSGSNTTLSISLRNLTATGQGNDFRLDEITVLDKCTDLDTDGDGIINSKDLDSDNDGCSDAVEAGTTFISTSGITTANQLTATIIPAPYGTNGFADGLDTVADSGSYKGTYTYANATNAAVKACTDTDKDGIADNNDLDDDNDGVLDTVECPVPQVALGRFGYTQTNGVTQAVDDNTIVNSSIYVSTFGNQTIGSGLSYSPITVLNGVNQLTLNAAITSNDFVEWSFNSTTNPTVLTRISQGLYNTNSWKASYMISKNGGAFTALASEQSIVGSASSYNTFNTNIDNYYITPNSSYKIRAYYYNLTGTNAWLDDIQFWLSSTNVTDVNNDGFITNLDVSCDTDGDGIPNRLDLDSDGDGCSDAFEGGATTNKTDSIIAGPYGTNGLANSKETATDNGVINYNLTYGLAINNLVKSCLDTDNDGIADYIDLDDDNDGILDTDECGGLATVYLENFQTNYFSVRLLVDKSVSCEFHGFIIKFGHLIFAIPYFFPKIIGL
jgi:hypothetical protein